MEEEAHMRFKVVIALIALVLMLFGCSNAPISNRANVGLDGENYIVETWASTSCANRGDTIHLRGTLTNNSSKTRVFQLRNKAVLDIGLSVGNVKVNWSDGKSLTPELTRLELKPGESKTVELDWVVTAVGSGTAAAIFTFSDRAGDAVGANVPLNVAPYCPGIGP